MSVKLSIVSYLSNFVVNVSRNCWEKTLNLADIKKLSEWHIQNNYHYCDKNRSHASIPFSPLVLNNFVKMKKQKAMAPSHHSNVGPTQKQVVPFFFCSGLKV